MNNINKVASLENLAIDVISSNLDIHEGIIQQLPVLNYVKKKLSYNKVFLDLKKRSIKMNKQYTIEAEINFSTTCTLCCKYPHDEIFKNNGAAALKQDAITTKIKLLHNKIATNRNTTSLRICEVDKRYIQNYYHYINNFISRLYQYFLNENIDKMFRLPILAEVINIYNENVDQIIDLAIRLSIFIDFLDNDLSQRQLTVSQKIFIAKELLKKIKIQRLSSFLLNKCTLEIELEYLTENNIKRKQMLSIINIVLGTCLQDE